MSDAVFISIVIPAYNYGHTLPRCIASVVSQWSDHVELIVVDDGSTDDTGAVIGGLALPPAPYFRYVRQENRGAAAARNHGLRLARGKFIILLDADDEMLPGTLSAVFSYLRNHPDVDLLIGGHIDRRADGREKTAYPVNLPSDPCARMVDYLIHKRISLGHGYFVASKQMLDAFPYPESLRQREDIPVFAYLLAQGSAATLDHAMVKIHKHATSLRHSNFGKSTNLEGYIEAVFHALPARCPQVRRRYAAMRYQAAFRQAIAGRDWVQARKFFLQSWRQNRREAWRPVNLRKALRALLLGR